MNLSVIDFSCAQTLCGSTAVRPRRQRHGYDQTRVSLLKVLCGVRRLPALAEWQATLLISTRLCRTARFAAPGELRRLSMATSGLPKASIRITASPHSE